MRSSKTSADLDALAEIASRLCRAAAQLSAPSGGRSAAEEGKAAVQCRDALLDRLAREFVPPMDRRDLAALAIRFCAPAEILAEIGTVPKGIGKKVKAAADALSGLAESLPKLDRPELIRPKIAEAFRCAGALRASLAETDAEHQRGSAWIRFADACTACAEAVAIAAVMAM